MAPDEHDLTKEDVEALQGTLTALKKSIDTAVDTAVDAKTKRWRNVFIGMAVAIGLALGGNVGLGLVALQASQDRDDLANVVDAQKSDTDQRRIDACERDNVARAGFRLIALTTATGFNQFAALLIGDSEIDADLQAQIDAFNSTVSGPLAALANEKTGPFADRDCSPEALEIGT